jgi:hypothetical protein
MHNEMNKLPATLYSVTAFFLNNNVLQSIPAKKMYFKVSVWSETIKTLAHEHIYMVTDLHSICYVLPCTRITSNTKCKAFQNKLACHNLHNLLKFLFPNKLLPKSQLTRTISVTRPIFITIHFFLENGTSSALYRQPSNYYNFQDYMLTLGNKPKQTK